MTGALHGNAHLIGREIQISDRIRWVLLPEKTWWPGVVYESYSELQKDIHPRKSCVTSSFTIFVFSLSCSHHSSFVCCIVIGFILVVGGTKKNIIH